MGKKGFSLGLFTMLSLQIITASSLLGSEGEGQQPKIGQAAPLFELTSLDGDTVALANLRGKFCSCPFCG